MIKHQHAPRYGQQKSFFHQSPPPGVNANPLQRVVHTSDGHDQVLPVVVAKGVLIEVHPEARQLPADVVQRDGDQG